MGRAIDADALREQFPEPKDWGDPEQALMHITGIWAEIDNAPTIEPEREKGHWVRWYEIKEDENGIEYIPRCTCSKCDTEYDPHSTRHIRFCTFCGANMMEERR